MDSFGINFLDLFVKGLISVLGGRERKGKI